MPKFTAVVKVYQNSKYDGTTTRGELHDLLDDNGQHVDETHSLWASDLLREVEDLFLWTDNPIVYGVPDRVHEVLGHKLSYQDFQSDDYGTYENGDINYDEHFVKVEFEAVPTEDDQNAWELVLSKEDGGKLDLKRLAEEKEVATWDKADLFDFYHKHWDTLIEEIQSLRADKG